jgi:hypothetical protein
MKFSHREEIRDDRVRDVLTDNERGLRIVVSRLGAELVSLARRSADGNWVGFLYRDNDLSKPARGWGNHSTVMGYFLHRLKDGHSLYRGREIRGGTHSFLRHKIFSDVRADLGGAAATSLTYRISPIEIAPDEYPLKVSLALTYALCGDELEVSFHFQNHEPQLTASSDCIPVLPQPASRAFSSKCRRAVTAAGSRLGIILAAKRPISNIPAVQCHSIVKPFRVRISLNLSMCPIAGFPIAIHRADARRPLTLAKFRM